MKRTTATISIDLETSPGPGKPEVSEAEVTAALQAYAEGKWKTPARQKQHVEDPVVRAEYTQALLEDWSKNALRSIIGEIFCISCVVDEKDASKLTPITFARHRFDSEEQMLKAWWKWVGQVSPHGPPNWVGWNISGFDFPFLIDRCIKHGMLDVARLLHPGKWGDNLSDLMEWTRWGRGRKPYKLDDYAAFLLGTGKPALSEEACEAIGVPVGTHHNGALVWRLLEAERFDDVVEYCESDALACARMYPALCHVMFRKNQFDV